MINVANKARGMLNLTGKIASLQLRRILAAQQAYLSRVEPAITETMSAVATTKPGNALQECGNYALDSFQRSILFCDTLRTRGNNFIEHERAGKPPLLVFEFETIVDGRTFKHPVNYALVRIIPPAGTKTDETKRPFIIIDPRAGHGPGIGGFKQDSQVGVALRAGHPVYFVIFYPRPEPGQTLEDVCEAQAHFVEVVAQRHPDSLKPAVIGNCQGGWSTMLLAASRPELVGPLVINGAPMSYWSGSWHGGEGENPMRYLGGLMGGAWAALLTADLGNGLVDGAHFVTNFERLNPANTLWSKYYHLLVNVDTEPPRFLEFERWWGGYSLMNEAELRWILDNLFVGNRLARGEAKAAPHAFFDLKSIRSPIIVFSSAGDNITPPQQALNWIADAYTSTEEIKANGQVIVGLFHEDVGHLGIFVSGKVAKKEHAQIVEVLEHIESLRPGLYVMEIHETKKKGETHYDVTIEERRLEDLRRINKLERRDEQPFEVVAEVSALTEKAYHLCVRPFVRPCVNEASAKLSRMFHPLRVQRWALSDLNPLMWTLPALASMVKARRHAAPPDNPYRRVEKAVSEVITARLDLYRDLRDAAMESLFFLIYGPPAVLGVGEQPAVGGTLASIDPRELPLVREALAAIGKGGYAEAMALIGALLGRSAGPIPLERLKLIERWIESDDVLSRLPADTVRRIKAEQAVVAELEPQRGLESLPNLLADPTDRRRALAALDEAMEAVRPTPQQTALIDRVRAVLGAGRVKSRMAVSNGSHLQSTAT